MHSRVSHFIRLIFHDASIFLLLCLRSTDPATAILPNQDEAFDVLLKEEVMKKRIK